MSTPTTTMPRLLVTGVPRTPSPYGLFTVATPRTSADPHWEMAGAQWESLPCRNASGIAAPDCDPETAQLGIPKSFGGENGVGPVINEADPFTVYAPYNCSALSHTQAEGQEIATQALLSLEQNYVEWELWTGHLGAQPNFPASAEEIAEGPLDPLVALAALEAWYHGHYGTVNGQAAVVHMGVGAATILAKKAALQYRNNQVFTPAGSRVVIGTGYGSAALDESGALTDRLYITPTPFVYRSEIFDSSNSAGDLLDRRQNDQYAIAERTYLIGWDDCPHTGTVELVYPSGGGGGGLPTPQYPFTVTEPAEGTVIEHDSYTTVSGTGRPGALISITFVGDGWSGGSTTATVAEDGSWSVNNLTVAAQGSGEAEIQATQGLRTESVTVHVEAQVDITSPTSSATGLDPTGAEVTGTGEPGKTITVTSNPLPSDTEITGTGEVEEDGTWTVTMNLSETEGDYTTTIHATDGNTSNTVSSIALAV